MESDKFKSIIDEQIAFIVRRFETIAETYGKVKNETLFSYVVSAVDEKRMQQPCHEILDHVVHPRKPLPKL